MYRRVVLRVTVSLTVLLSGCAAGHRMAAGSRLERVGDEIAVCGQLYHTGTAVVLWTDPGGYDAYRVERRFAPLGASAWETSAAEVKDLKTPNRYNTRKDGLSEVELERVRGGGWDLALLQRIVDQFVIHYDVSGTSKQCFQTLHDERGLSVHFLLDLDGTIYQTLDLKERAWHATVANTRSVGIEIANIGAYGTDDRGRFAAWYVKGSDGRTRVTIPPRLGDGGQRLPNFTARPDRDEIVTGTIQGQSLRQYDFTPQQYEALIRLTATLCRIFPALKCDYPRDSEGCLVTGKLPDEALAVYRGLLGHYHVQANKIDPGPAFQWDRVIKGARRLME